MKNENLYFINQSYTRIQRKIAEKLFDYGFEVVITGDKYLLNSEINTKASFEKNNNWNTLEKCENHFFYYNRDYIKQNFKYFSKDEDIKRLNSKFAIVDFNQGQLPISVNEALNYTDYTKLGLTEHFKMYPNDILKIKHDCYVFGLCLTENFNYVKNLVNQNQTQV